MMKKFLAFTLSEVLITVGVIGVVSALTIPNLVKNYHRQLYATQLRKITSELQQAYKNVLVQNNALNLKETRAFETNSAWMHTLSQYLDNATMCDTPRKTDCLGTTAYEELNGTAIEQLPFSGYPCIKLNSGAVICGDVEYYGTTHSLWIDINGKQGPNIACMDLFRVKADPKGKIEPSLDFMVGHATLGVVKLDTCYSKIIQDGWKIDYSLSAN